MRKAARIEPLISALRDLWLANPDLRFFQLLVHLTGEHSLKDLFYVEDKDALEIIKGKLAPDENK